MTPPGPSALPARPKVAIVIPTANPHQGPATSAIARARATTAHLGATVHVVESSGPAFRFSRSVNAGLRAAPDADAWVLLNDDCVMDDGWLEAFLDASRSHPDAGLLGAVLRFPDGRLQHAGGYILEPWQFLRQYAFVRKAPLWALRRMLRAKLHDHPYVGHYHRVRAQHRLDYVTGACLFITAACRQAIGEFDEDYEFSFEDIDYALRALEAGQEVALAVDATGVHLERASGGGLDPQIRRSERLFRERWPTARVLKATRSKRGRGVHHSRAHDLACGCAPESSTQA